MSPVLQYGATCDECGRFMRPGTQFESAKGADGTFRRVHAGACPGDDVPRPVVRRPPAEHDICTCPHCLADWCFDKGAFARGKGRGVPGCPTCQQPWDALYADIEAGLLG